MHKKSIDLKNRGLLSNVDLVGIKIKSKRRVQ